MNILSICILLISLVTIKTSAQTRSSGFADPNFNPYNATLDDPYPRLTYYIHRSCLESPHFREAFNELRPLAMNASHKLQNNDRVMRRYFGLLIRRANNQNDEDANAQAAYVQQTSSNYCPTC